MSKNNHGFVKLYPEQTTAPDPKKRWMEHCPTCKCLVPNVREKGRVRDTRKDLNLMRFVDDAGRFAGQQLYTYQMAAMLLFRNERYIRWLVRRHDLTRILIRMPTGHGPRWARWIVLPDETMRWLRVKIHGV